LQEKRILKKSTDFKSKDIIFSDDEFRF
jgi:hypothetical protein